MANNKYIFLTHCPSNSLLNGGAETLHQLAFHLKENNYNSYINYFPDIDITNLPDNLLKYQIPKKNFIDDYNIINIIPEVETFRSKLISKGNCIIYWLSIDSYFRKNEDKPFWKNWNYYRKSMKKRVFLFNLKKYHHLANSYYAQEFLNKKKFSTTLIRGYISDFFDGKFDTKKKENIILYNPTKDQTHYKKIKKLFPQYKFVGLSNMSKMELKDMYLKSKIFLDLGTHPGRERMPRESSVMGCVLILANRGSVKNDFDVPVDDIYKFDLKKKDVYLNIGNLIQSIFDNFQSHITSFKKYREEVSNSIDKKKFSNDAKSFALKTIEKLEKE